MTDPQASGPVKLPRSVVTLLMECALIISSYRNKNQAAGYPFREPPGVNEVITRIDGMCGGEGYTRNKKIVVKIDLPDVPVFIFNRAQQTKIDKL